MSFGRTKTAFRKMMMNQRQSVCFAFVTALIAISAPAQVIANEQIFKKTVLSTAWIISPIETEKDSSKDPTSFSVGTGVLIDLPQCLLLTAYHVVGDRPTATVFFPQFEKGELITDPKFYLEDDTNPGIHGLVVAKDPIHDLALIELNACPSLGVSAVLAAHSAEPGQSVFAIGNAGVDNGALWGYVDGKVRQVYRKQFRVGLNQNVDSRVIETTMPTNQEDNGGPTFNFQGELVAMTLGSSKNRDAVDYCVDISEIRSMINAYRISVEPPKPIFRSDAALPLPSPVEVGTNTPYEAAKVAGASARVSDLRIEHNVEKDGSRGLLLHCDVGFQNLKSVEHPYQISMFVYDGNGKRLETPIKRRPGEKFTIEATEFVTVPKEQMFFHNVTLFIPYDAIADSLFTNGSVALLETSAQERLRLHCGVNVKDIPGRRWISAETVAEPFDYNLPRQISIPVRTTK